MTGDQYVRVWDPLVRVFHWTLVVAFTIAYLTEDDLLTVHVWAGYTVLGLVVFRILWGFVGPRYARFSSFVTSPGTALAYARDVLRGTARRYLGHNPAGGLMIMILLVLLLLISLTGLAVYGAEEHAGPLAGFMAGREHWEDFLEETHEVLSNLTVLLVFVHIAGVLVESMVHRENLVRAMIDGRKRAPSGEDEAAGGA